VKQRAEGKSKELVRKITDPINGADSPNKKSDRCQYNCQIGNRSSTTRGHRIRRPSGRGGKRTLFERRSATSAESCSGSVRKSTTWAVHNFPLLTVQPLGKFRYQLAFFTETSTTAQTHRPTAIMTSHPLQAVAVEKLPSSRRR